MSMELFISDAQPEDTLSFALELYANYVRANQREIVQLTKLSPGTLKALQIEQVPLLVKSVTETSADNQVETKEARLTNPFSIMLEIARACYLEEILFAKEDSVTRTEIGSFVEMVGRLNARELCENINTHMAMRMFLVGENITAADIVVFSALAPLFSTELQAYEKIALPHAFRWIDHVQHLPGMLEQVQGRSMFTSFPNIEEEGEGPSKSQLKKMAKAQAAKEAKAKKATGGEAAAGNDKSQQQKKPQQAQGADAAAAAGGEETKQAPKKQKQKQQQKPKAPAAPVVEDIAQMDIRVGKIVECWKHPESEKLYCEKIDIGNGEIRQIASGLQKFVPLEKMQGAMCIVLCNLKAKKLGGFPSHGMVLCSKTGAGESEATELLVAPEGSVPGDLITFEGQGRDPPAQLPPKDEKNPWFRVQPDLQIDGTGVAKWNTHLMATPKGNVTTPTLRNANIS